MKSKMVFLAKKETLSVRVLIGAVTYRAPMPVTKAITYTSDTYPICPRCDRSLEREYMSFCDRCGQKLNWDFFDYAKVIHPNYRKE